MKQLIYVVSLLTLVNCSTKEKSTHSVVNDTTQVPINASDVRAANASVSQAQATTTLAVGAQKWIYQRTNDNVGQPVYKALITSSNRLEFPFPYGGGSSATLTIRKRSSGTNVYLEVSKGQFNRSFQGGNARIRFDNKPAGSYAFSAAENGRGNIIFFDAEQKLISQLKAARQTIIDVGFDGQGSREITFRTADLRWDH
ncbi:hypothetical protein [Spirosoma agri]|uniref:DUF4251 domain-containing protein n=1 Tax=Spirosoma agri TaxID=1987381 RepID=A0A6M0IPL7_9BACT|nr:hypothetical protein [Spirosoma agri]NEU69882.1 hypothetical protein [Spirosoma agri]